MLMCHASARRRGKQSEALRFRARSMVFASWVISEFQGSEKSTNPWSIQEDPLLSLPPACKLSTGCCQLLSQCVAVKIGS